MIEWFKQRFNLSPLPLDLTAQRARVLLFFRFGILVCNLVLAFAYLLVGIPPAAFAMLAGVDGGVLLAILAVRNGWPKLAAWTYLIAAWSTLATTNLRLHPDPNSPAVWALSLDGRPLSISASPGISLYPRDGEDARSLLKCADAAMYHVKVHEKNAFYLFSPQEDGSLTSAREQVSAG